MTGDAKTVCASARRLLKTISRHGEETRYCVDANVLDLVITRSRRNGREKDDPALRPILEAAATTNAILRVKASTERETERLIAQMAETADTIPTSKAGVREIVRFLVDDEQNRLTRRYLRAVLSSPVLAD
jgi:hypothetical protein